MYIVIIYSEYTKTKQSDAFSNRSAAVPVFRALPIDLLPRFAVAKNDSVFGCHCIGLSHVKGYTLLPVSSGKLDIDVG
jgi:hypothetical protein